MKKKDKSKVTSKEMTEVEKFRKQYPTQQARMNYYAEAFHLTRKRREEEGGSE